MDSIEGFLQSLNWDMVIATSLKVTLILVVGWVATKLLRESLRRFEHQLIRRGAAQGEPPSESEKRISTILKLVRQAALLALWITVGLMVLRELGVEITPIIASAGVAGVAIGFGAQNLVRDVIAGFFIILENQIRVGDVAVVNGSGGLVEQINFRTTVLRDLSGTVHIFPNGAITTLSNMTNEWSAYVFEVGVAYKENTDTVVEAMRKVGEALTADVHFGELMLGPPEIFGVDRLGDSAVIIKGRIKTKPIRQWDVGREYLRRIKLAFDEAGIEIPFPHRTLYLGEKPLDVRIAEATKKR
jgi:small conductance mechanosensitive channel